MIHNLPTEKVAKIVEYSEEQHKVHLRGIFESFVGSRFQSLKELKDRLKAKTKEKIILFESETDADFLHDFQLDGEIGNMNEFSLFYLKDRKDYLYITEIAF